MSSADIDTANWWLGNNSFRRGMTEAERKRLQDAGYSDPTTDFLESWRTSNKDAQGRPHPIQWGGELSRVPMAQNEARYSELLGLSQLRKMQGNEWMDSAGRARAGAFASGRDALGDARRAYETSLGNLDRDYAAAGSELSGMFAGQRQGIQDRQSQNLGSVRASMMGRGLGNTTALDNANRGVYADTERAMTNLGAAEAGTRANFNTNRAGARFAAGTGYSNFLGGMADRMYGMGSDTSSFLERRAMYDDQWLKDRQDIINGRMDVGQAPTQKPKKDNTPIWAAGLGALGMIGSALF